MKFEHNFSSCGSSLRDSREVCVDRFEKFVIHKMYRINPLSGRYIPCTKVEVFYNDLFSKFKQIHSLLFIFFKEIFKGKLHFL